MSDVLRWTPIQEGRFHFRSMRDGETIVQYLMRVYPEADERKKNRRRISILIQAARAESRKRYGICIGCGFKIAKGQTMCGECVCEEESY